MKRMTQLTCVSLAILGTLWMAGCTDDDDPLLSGPSISITSDDDISGGTFTGYEGDTLEVDVNVNAPAGFNNLEVLANGVRDTLISRAAGTTQTSFSTTYEYVLNTVGDVTLTFKAVDDDNNTTSEVITVTGEQKPTRHYTAKLLYAPAGDNSSETFFSTNDGMIYSKADVEGTAAAISPKIDFGYYYGDTDMASLAAPSAYPTAVYDLSAWAERNETKLRKTDLSVSEFMDNVNNINFIESAYDNATSEGDDEIVTQLSSGFILAFELDDVKGSKHGLIRVLDIEPGTATDDYIEIEVVVVK